MTPEQNAPVPANGATSVIGSSDLLADIHRRLIMASEDWRTLPSDPHNINTPVYIAMLEVANVIEAALKSANVEVSNPPSNAR